MNLEDILGDLDKWFSQKKPNEANAIFALAIAGLVGLSYAVLWDPAEQGYNKTVIETQNVQKKLTDDENYLKWNPISKIAQIKAQTVQYNQQFIALKDQTEYIKFKIEQISSLYYDEQAWGEFIDSISENAKKYDVQLRYLSNEFSNEKGTFGHILNIEVRAKGSFHKTMKFIDSLEQSFLVVDVHNINLIASDKVNSNLKISVWGITY